MFGDRDLREAHCARHMAPGTPGRAVSGAEALLAWLDGAADLAGGPCGVIGYRMGGGWR